MSNIRFPQTGAELIRFVSGQKVDSTVEIFTTFAHLLCFGACLGYRRDERDMKPEFAEKPNPIAFEVFRNNGLLHPLQIMALASTRKHEILREDNPEEFITLVEQYASGGLRFMRKLLDEHGGGFYYRVLIDELEHAALDHVKPSAP